MVIDVTDQTFEDEVIKSNLPVLVDIWASWCRPCLMLAPLLDELAGKYDGKIDFVKIDVDQNQNIAARYGIMSIPTLLIFKDGQPVSHIIGFRPKEELKQSLDAVLR